MDYKRILTVQDISCVGQCSLTVALPILSACGIETAILPSAVLSTHTGGGFSGWTFRDLTDDMPAIGAHWEKEGLLFDAVYSGYLGSEKQIDYVKDLFRLGKADCKKIVDPAMADNGKLYYGFDTDFVASMKTLCAQADFVLPNVTEACFLTETPYQEQYDEAYVRLLLDRLHALGAKTVILTGISYQADYTGVVISEQGATQYYRHRKLPFSSHGTGDIFASAFAGALLRGKSAYDSAKVAADYTVRCMEVTGIDPTHRYGVKFELVLGELIDMVK
jgi:pyridoxine kinase